MISIEKKIKITDLEVKDYAKLTGDYNPIHFDNQFAIKNNYKSRIVHGPLLLTKITTIFANEFPGSGTIYLSHEYKFLKPIYIDEDIKIVIHLLHENEKKHLFVSTKCFNQENILIFDGIARLKKN
jgi:3-hydroxybutyryl-CoA dehydratase